MVEIGELEAYLNDKSAKENDICVVTGEGSIQELDGEFGKRRVLNIPVELNGRAVIWTPGKLALNAAEQVFKSRNTTKWVGQKFAVGFVKMTVKGQIKDIIVPKAI
jgi:hypothetical protein